MFASSAGSTSHRSCKTFKHTKIGAPEWLSFFKCGHGYNTKDFPTNLLRHIKFSGHIAGTQPKLNVHKTFE